MGKYLFSNTPQNNPLTIPLTCNKLTYMKKTTTKKNNNVIPEKIGFTTSVPVEVLFAAGKVPVDLNNIFINAPHATDYIEQAELAGFPRNMCAWIKGIYTAAVNSDISEVIGVIQGDCSNAQALMEVLIEHGMNTYHFAYPYDRGESFIKLSIDKMMKHYGVGMKSVMEQKARLDRIRRKIRKVDKMTHVDNIVSSFENHYFQVSASDFNLDPDNFEDDIDIFLKSLPEREPFKEDIRLGYIGVPPIFTDLYDFLDSHGARVVYNEVQQQFSMPYNTKTIYEQYLKFSYPYDIFGRIKVIKAEIKKRRLDGVIHYVQSFCFRQIEDLIVRKALGVPMLLLEGDRPMRLDARTKLRLEVFLEMLGKR